MSHFLVVCMIDEPDPDDVAGYRAMAREKVAEQEGPGTQIGWVTLTPTPPVTGEDKTLRTWAEARLQDVLAPYDEQREVEARPVRCYCVGEVAKREAREAVKSERPDLHEFDARRERLRVVGVLRRVLEPGSESGEYLPSTEAEDDRALLRELDLGDELDHVLAGNAIGKAREQALAAVAAVDERQHDEWAAMHDEREALTAARLAEHPLRDSPDPRCGRYYYQTFDIPLDATHEQIQTAFRAKMDEEMQDGPGDGPGDIAYRAQRWDERLKWLREGRRILSDPELRAAYDAKGDDDGDDYCFGTGMHASTSNDRGYWDWWCIGGRWAGVFAPEYDPDQDPRNFEPCHFCRQTGLVAQVDGSWTAAPEGYPGAKECHVCLGTKIERRFHNAEVEHDIVPAAQYERLLAAKGEGASRKSPDRYGIPYALVTPDGEWHSQGKMGWFGMSDDEESDQAWYERALTLVRENLEGRLAIAVDAHV